MKHPFSDEFGEPPALVLDVRVIAPGTDRGLTLKGKLDTAADVSAVPIQVINRIRALKFGNRNLTVTGLGRMRVTSYEVEIEIAGQRLWATAVGLDKPYVLLGRDILNQLHFTVDGPNEEFWFHPRQ